MKDLLSKETYCYKIHTLRINKKQCSFNIYTKISFLMIFQKFQPPTNNGETSCYYGAQTAAIYS